MKYSTNIVLFFAFFTAYICFSPVICFSGLFDIQFNPENMTPQKIDHPVEKLNKSLKIIKITGCNFREKVNQEFYTSFQKALLSALEDSNIFSKIILDENKNADYSLEVNILHQFAGVICSSRHFINYKISEIPNNKTIWEDRMYSIYNHRPCEGFDSFSKSVEGCIKDNIQKFTKVLSEYIQQNKQFTKTE